MHVLSYRNFIDVGFKVSLTFFLQAPRERFIAKYDFGGRDPEDLPFKKGEVLTVLQKDEDQWWTARNVGGDTGLIPVPYIQKVAMRKGKPGNSLSQNTCGSKLFFDKVHNLQLAVINTGCPSPQNV